MAAQGDAAVVRRCRAHGAGASADPAPERRRRAGHPAPSSCRGTSRSSWTATAAGPRSAGCRAPPATRPARRACSTCVHGAIELGVGWISAYAFSTENWKRSPDEVRVPHGLQPRRDPAPPRRDARPRRARALGGPAAAALEERHRRARGGRADDRRQLHADAHDVRQLRRSRRDRRCRAGDRARGRRRSARSRARSTSARSPATSTSPTCPTSTCSCARRASSARATSCCGSRRTPSWSSSPTLWPDFDRRHLWWACEQYASRDRRYGGAVPNDLPDGLVTGDQRRPRTAAQRGWRPGALEVLDRRSAAC